MSATILPSLQKFSVRLTCRTPYVLSRLYSASVCQYRPGLHISNQSFSRSRFHQQRHLSTGSAGDAFNRFRSYRSGQQFTKAFGDAASQFTASVAYHPKDRKPKDGDFVAEFKRMSGSDQAGHDKNVCSDAAIDAASSPTGEDNYVLGYSKEGLILGVLDGVGGWADMGYDSSAISRELAKTITRLYLAKPETPVGDLLNEAFKEVRASGHVKVGSTTACFGVIDSKTKKLSALNLGDSWFGVFRKQQDGHYRCFYQSKFQTYFFNAPYQLSIIPEKMIREATKKGTNYLMNEPKDADSYSVQLQSQDVVIFTTDGLVDNVGPEDIEIYLDDNLGEKQKKLGETNSKLVTDVVTLAKNPSFDSVFSQELSKVTGQHYTGGKPDDVTSVMVYVH